MKSSILILTAALLSSAAAKAEIYCYKKYNAEYVTTPSHQHATLKAVTAESQTAAHDACMAAAKARCEYTSSRAQILRFTHAAKSTASFDNIVDCERDLEDNRLSYAVNSIKAAIQQAEAPQSESFFKRVGSALGRASARQAEFNAGHY